jgi:hypothetical protein
MRRDMDLAREMLRQIEARPDIDGWIEFSIPGRSDAELSYHVQLLAEAGFVAARDISTKGRHDWQAVRLTWAGHEFLDAARDDSVWQNAKRTPERNAKFRSCRGIEGGTCWHYHRQARHRIAAAYRH